MLHPDLLRIVDNAEWQKLRVSFLGTWKHTPEENVRKLKRYLGNAVRNPRSPKFIRVYNYLTGSAFRIGVISHPAITELHATMKRAWDGRH
jgi:hypothetical protein